MFEQITTHVWMMLSREVRQQLITDFDLSRNGVTEVIDDRVITDGYNNDDLKVITLERMAEYVGSTGTFMDLWQITCSKANGIINPPIPVVIATAQVSISADKTTKNDSKKSK